MLFIVTRGSVQKRYDPSAVTRRDFVRISKGKVIISRWTIIAHNHPPRKRNLTQFLVDTIRFAAVVFVSQTLYTRQGQETALFLFRANWPLLECSIIDPNKLIHLDFGKRYALVHNQWLASHTTLVGFEDWGLYSSGVKVTGASFSLWVSSRLTTE